MLLTECTNIQSSSLKLLTAPRNESRKLVSQNEFLKTCFEKFTYRHLKPISYQLNRRPLKQKSSPRNAGPAIGGFSLIDGLPS